MKRTNHFWLVIVVAGIAVLPAASQTSGSENTALGDYARAQRANKKQQAAKQFDNDNLPKVDKLNVVGPAVETSTAAPSSDEAKADENKGEEKKGEEKKADEKAEVKPGQSAQERQQVYDQWEVRISGQKAQVDLLSRELDVAQREYRLRQAAMYGDAGDRLRNQAAWDKEDADYKQHIAEKQKALNDAKAEMGNMEEEARRSGVPSSVTENAEQNPAQPQPPAPPQAQPPAPEPPK